MECDSLEPQPYLSSVKKNKINMRPVCHHTASIYCCINITEHNLGKSTNPPMNYTVIKLMLKNYAQLQNRKKNKKYFAFKELCVVMCVTVMVKTAASEGSISLDSDDWWFADATRSAPLVCIPYL